MTRISRNAPCPCGSGKKYKHCCMRADESSAAGSRAAAVEPREPARPEPVRFPASPFEERHDLPDFDEDSPLADLASMHPLVVERALLQLARILRSRGLGADDEFDESLIEFLRQDELPEVPPETPLEEARERAYDAWFAEDADERVRLARQALEISPDCADAYSLLAEETAESDDDALALYRQAVAAAERAYGPRLTADDAGSPWTLMEIRPYLRARMGLAETLMRLGRGEEAIAEWRDVLRIDAADSQGARYALLAELLRAGRRDEAEALLKRFKDEESSTWRYGQALVAFQQTGAKRAANRKLREALEANPYLAVYLLGIAPIPPEPPSEDDPNAAYVIEAALSAAGLGAAWEETPGALGWLAKEFEALIGKLDPTLGRALRSVTTSPAPELLIANPSTLGGRAGGAAEGLAMPDRRAMERHHANLHRILRQREFASVDEANAYLGSLMAAGDMPRIEPETPLERAQEIMYDAWEAQGRQRVKLARQALEISPDCADAYVLLAEETATSPREALELYRQGVEAGERALGPELLGDAAGEFWGILATRPYMRARQGLAECLLALGRRDEAIVHLQDMLRLNPGDNQGIRYLLLAALLESGDRKAARRLLQQYPDDIRASWAYGRALLTFQEKGPGIAARRQLNKALDANPFVPDYLTGQRPMPVTPPPYIQFGDESEALAVVAEQVRAWSLTPGALDWLIDVTDELAGRDRL